MTRFFATVENAVWEKRKGLFIYDPSQPEAKLLWKDGQVSLFAWFNQELKESQSLSVWSKFV